ncbi:formyltransferase family protein [Butyrivibrio sp. NC3005]|uniref:formyltransferase family protein n=1 Tax=Butyrivibrio sp. NC3005 TaxID=1280685 RepID=UPI00040A3AD6|nr:formyltransferase family protein [Butyrivibrio sp. NC3005]
MTYQKKNYPLVSHRPAMTYNILEITDVCKNLGYKYEETDINCAIVEIDRICLIAGANIIPNDFVREHTIINSHPGYIPNCRGLDSFKWAIVEDQPIGATTHIVGEYVDAGLVIERRKIPILKYDTFHSVAQRVYENEISMLVDAIERYKQQECINILPGDSIVHKRMPKEIEVNIFDLFQKYKDKHQE